MAAGLTSAITAPLAAAYAVSGAMGWPTHFHDRRFKAIWMLVLALGTLFAALGTKPIAAILFAQAANGILLPVTAIFLIIIMNRTELLGEYRNRLLTNIFGVAVVTAVTGLGLWNIVRLFV
jgi:Mn2+/Fe2+ NRAMP family transporter